MTVLELQTALRDAGFDPGPLDGVPGRRTREAVLAFQRARGLVADGIVGPATTAALGAVAPPVAPAVPSSMPWLEEARRLIGTREEPGRGSNEAIVGWARAIRLTQYTGDDIPWCGLFVAHCLSSQLPGEALPSAPLWARAWRRFGDAAAPGLGTVLVFWREDPAGSKGHVGFYWAEDARAYHVLGGNQSDAVTVTRVAKDRLLDARWPHTAMPADPWRVARSASARGALSTSEA